MKNFDCAIVPGGGLQPDGKLPPWTEERLNKAVLQSNSTKYIFCLSGGTVHKPPPRNKMGFPIFESRAAADYLIQKGVSPHKIRSEICSYDTIGNAYFSRMLFADPLNCRSCLVITSEFHMPRTKSIFNWIYQLSCPNYPFSLSFLCTPNTGLSPKALKARINREKNSLKNLEKIQSKINSLQDLHVWIYEEHQAYAAGLSPETAAGSELESY
jgi:hypothetical protein